ncbi:hypothetical protein GCM10023094_40640 [Rhodococcus olei]|uniref:FHA domain-containing protein n=1 Tax=Rhodococcus olei TaxID=2161675 RepID=A0ABP8PCY2_9NOCA
MNHPVPHHEYLPSLRYTDLEGRPHERALPEDRPQLTLGRAPEADVVLHWDTNVSRLHATIERIAAQWTIVDDGLSRNGTFVNGERITGRRRLRSGDHIRVGSSVLTFRFPENVSGDMTGVADAMPTRTSLTEAQRAVLLELCRPYKRPTTYANPASNQQIAARLFLSVETVKTHLRALFGKFAVEDLPQNAKRARLVERAMQSGVVTDRDL